MNDCFAGRLSRMLTVDIRNGSLLLLVSVIMWILGIVWMA